jgi:hypothetical protein
VKLTISQLVHKFSTFYGTRSFISTFTSAHHLSLAWARWIQSLSPRHDASSGCGWRGGLQYRGLLQIDWISSRGQPTRGGPPTWGVVRGANNSSPSKTALLRNRCTFLSRSNYWHLNSCPTVASRLVSRRRSNPWRVFVVGRWQLPWRRRFLQIACQPVLLVASKEVRVGVNA